MMKLYGNHTSPFVRHCRIALREEELSFELVEVDAAGSGERSPLKKMPFLETGDEGGLTLTDSTAILKYARERSGKSFMPDIEDFNAYCAASTLLDSAINLFYLEKDGIKANAGSYLKRQEARLRTGLGWLDSLDYAGNAHWTDSRLRIACFLDWALFRQRFEIDAYPRLVDFLTAIKQYPPFAATAPRA